MDRNAVCDAYADVAHGSVEPSKGTRQNDLVTITCDDGYELVESLAVCCSCCSVLQTGGIYVGRYTSGIMRGTNTPTTYCNTLLDTTGMSWYEAS